MSQKRTITVQILNAFVKNNTGGNPAGIVLNADALSHEDKLTIAQKVGLSETAFISQSKTADFKLDFYTPNKQIAHCGHATIATFSYLKQLGFITKSNSSKETIDGDRNIQLRGELAFMEQTAPVYQSVSEKEEQVLASLGLQREDMLHEPSMKIVNTGNSFLVIPVKNSNVLKKMVPDFELIKSISEEFGLIGYYVFTTDTNNEQIDVTTRMFAPFYGINEESATGTAAGTLASYLYDFFDIKKSSITIEQGVFMEVPSPSEIFVDLNIKDNKIEGLFAGGKGILMKKIELDW